MFDDDFGFGGDEDQWAYEEFMCKDGGGGPGCSFSIWKVVVVLLLIWWALDLIFGK
ncbi:MAG: hypothetical protein IKZ81_02165 [Clostridia bacterium]|nr:hypothetical protein [Clostridia bacterium]MBR5769491.1 hypothetical protein [Clostridia bacterium]MBR5942127.1 hypothetical protein [Clostridia bacterium]